MATECAKATPLVFSPYASQRTVAYSGVPYSPVYLWNGYPIACPKHRILTSVHRCIVKKCSICPSRPCLFSEPGPKP
jgi:hypothetical protein